MDIREKLLRDIHAHGEKTYPEEGAGFLLGTDSGVRKVTTIFTIINAREDEARHHRYLITPQNYLKAEVTADELGLSLLGVFHSHPDRPNQPSRIDREWALPFFSYLITSVEEGKAVGSRAWRLQEDRSAFVEEELILIPE